MNRIVQAICPNLPSDKRIHETMNSERWLKIINGALNIPPEGVLRANFITLEKTIEALRAFEVLEEQEMLWDDHAIVGRTCYSAAECIEGIDFLKQQKVLSVDIETRHTGYTNNKILLIGFAYSPTEAISFAYPGINEPSVRTAFRDLLESKDITFIYQNGKFDTGKIKWLWDIEARVDEDTMLQHYVGINERKGTHSLDDLGMLYLGTPNWKKVLDDYKKSWCAQHKIKLEEFTWDNIPLSILIPYNYRDCCVTFRLNSLFHKVMRPETQWLYRQLIRASNVYRKIELAGNLVDMDYLYFLQDDLDTKILTAEKIFKKLVKEEWNPFDYVRDTGARALPREFNYSSPKQLKWMLEKVTGARLTTTNKDALNELAEKYPDVPFIQAIMELRRWNKYMDTYVTGLEKSICEDGRVRSTFNLHGTETGRLSSKEPNMQNIPRSPYIKNLFVARPGYKLVQLDYSQAELRVLAWLSQDLYLKNIYKEGKDLHNEMATEIFGPNFTKEERVGAKTVNFGIPYGRGPSTIAYKLKMTVAKAAMMIRRWFETAPKAKKFLDERRAEPFSREGKVYQTIFGRQRHYVITSENRNHIGNQAVNFPISSLASDLTMLSVLDISEQMEEEALDALIVNTVHDSIIIEAHDDEETIKRVVQIGTKVMSEMAPRYLKDLDFPFVADAESGRSWGDMEHEDTIFEQEDLS